MIAGTDIRDFCQNFFANTINNTTTRNAFAVNHVRDSCGTGNVNTGLVTDYRVDEISFILPTAFATQTLSTITVVPSDAGRPLVLGVTVVN